MKILILAVEITPYFSNNYKRLTEEGHDLLVLHFTDAKSPNFLHNELDKHGIRHINCRSLNVIELIKTCNIFGPKVLMCAGWNIRPFLILCLITKAKRVLLTDSKWQASSRQKFAIKFRKILIKPYFDYAFVPGTPQEIFMLKLGFPPDKIFKGIYNVSALRNDILPISQAGRAFLYVGRLSPEKGIIRMLEGYKIYRTQSNNPYELRIVGVGELLSHISFVPGVNYLGYVPNSDLPDLIQNSKALVLLSEREAWGVVIAESVANCRPIICSDACGAAVDLVEDGDNGWILENPSPESIADAFLKFEMTTPENLEQMSQASKKYAHMYGPNTWIDFLEQIHS